MGLKSESKASTTASRVRNNSVTYPCMSSPCSAMVSTRRDKTSDSIRDVIGTRRALNINNKGLLSDLYFEIKCFTLWELQVNSKTEQFQKCYAVFYKITSTIKTLE